MSSLLRLLASDELSDSTQANTALVFITNQLVSDNIAGVSLASSEIGASAGTALSAAGTLAKEADRLEREVAAFLSQIRAA